MRRALSFSVVLAAIALLAAICVTRKDDLATALDAVPPAAFVALVALHVLTLICRSEAWRLTLGGQVARDAVHGANAGAFLAGSLESHTAMPARIALLMRLAPGSAPPALRIALADVPIFVLEVCGTVLLLAASGRWPWWVSTLAFAGVATVLAVRRPPRALAGIVAAITLLGAARVLIALWATGLAHGPGDVAVVFAALGVFGLLPLGPSASPGATLAAAGSAGVGGALAAGLCISASSIAAVLVYAIAIAALHLGKRAELRLQAIRRERAEPVELGVLGAMEIGRAGGQQAELARASAE